MIDTVFDELVDCSRLLVLILVVIERCYRTDVDVLCWFLLTTVKVGWKRNGVVYGLVTFLERYQMVFVS